MSDEHKQMLVGAAAIGSCIYFYENSVDKKKFLGVLGGLVVLAVWANNTMGQSAPAENPPLP